MSAELVEVVKSRSEVAVFLRWKKSDEEMSYDEKNEKLKKFHDFFNNINLKYHNRNARDASDACIESINKSNASIFACRSGNSRITFVTEVTKEKELEDFFKLKKYLFD